MGRQETPMQDWVWPMSLLKLAISLKCSVAILYWEGGAYPRLNTMAGEGGSGLETRQFSQVHAHWCTEGAWGCLAMQD